VTTIARLPDVKSRTGLSKTGIYRLIAQGQFPRAVPLGPRTVGWLAEDVDQWIASRVAARDSSHRRCELGGRRKSARQSHAE
jgi:prophage regulatory protein